MKFGIHGSIQKVICVSFEDYTLIGRYMNSELESGCGSSSVYIVTVRRTEHGHMF
jgi:hypothetical protein